MPNHKDDQPLIDAVNALEKCGGNKSQAALMLGLDRSTFRGRLAAAWRKLGIAPNIPRVPVPQGCQIGKTTLQVDAGGNVSQQWARLHPSQEALEDFADTLINTVKQSKPRGAIKPVRKSPDNFLDIVIGDPHAGMYADGKNGDSYNLQRFTDLHRGGVEYLLGKAGPQKHVRLLCLGDLFHSNNKEGTTDRSKHVLDMAGTWSEVRSHVQKTWLDIVDMTAASCQQLTVVNLDGNHCGTMTPMFNGILAAWYRNSPHITVVNDDNPRHYFQYGDNLIAATHGHEVKAAKLQQLMASEQAQMWADTKHRTWRCGHFHTHKRQAPMWTNEEAPGVDVEYFPVLSGDEAYGLRAGYCSHKKMVAVVHDATMGEVERYAFRPEMLK